MLRQCATAGTACVGRLLIAIQRDAAFAVSLGDTLDHLRSGRLRAATQNLMDRRNFVSLGAVLENAHVLTRLARLG